MSRPVPRPLLVRAVACVVVLAPASLAVAEPAGAATTTQMKKDVVSLLNAYRKTAGCAPLRVDARLQQAAGDHSYDMRRLDYFSHTSRDGRSPWTRIRATGYRYGSAENIAAGQRTPKAVVDAWMKSPGHRANILNCANKAVGTGVSRGSGTYYIYWTQDFGRV